VGPQRPALGNTTIWVLIAFVGVAVAIALAFGFIKLFSLPLGNVDAKAYGALPTWVLLVASFELDSSKNFSIAVTRSNGCSH
jgi:hypothetical protein